LPVKQHFVFYANASAQIGSGHIMRLLAIAQVCMQKSIKVTFLCTQCPDALQQRLISEGFGLQILPLTFTLNDIQRELQQKHAHAIFVDDYQITLTQWQVFKGLNALLVNLDDNLDDQPLVSDLIINPAADANAQRYAQRAPAAKLLLGPQYTYLRQEFAEQTFVNIDQRTQILITLGGADVKNMSYWLVKQIAEKLPHVDICILLGALNTTALAALKGLCERLPRVTLIHHSNHVANLMMQSGLAITAAGGTLGELASMGVPSIALVSSDNQLPALKSPLLNTWYTCVDVRNFDAPAADPEANLSQAHSPIECLPSQAILDDVVSQVAELWPDLCKRQQMSDYARQIIDSCGCERIVQATLQQL
jgi:UDP-2,4-diacetamido-2,4,6-trideoxy-beta-L-altropyranose hydrolase